MTRARNYSRREAADLEARKARTRRLALEVAMTETATTGMVAWYQVEQERRIDETTCTGGPTRWRTRCSALKPAAIADLLRNEARTDQI